MRLNSISWKILSRVLLLAATIAGAAFLLVKENYIYSLCLLPAVLYEMYELYHFQKKTHDELEEFVQSVHYRDFSRYFDVKSAAAEVQPLRQGFNEINDTFKNITREKETQHQYLHKILELVDTGILSYKENGGEVIWMNGSLKKMLDVPFLKTIHSLEKRNSHLYKEILSLKNGSSHVSLLQQGAHSFKVLISATAFYTEGNIIKLVALQNINEALDENEAQAWQKLLSVLTHEIMNSIAPISSLADTLKNRLQESAARIQDENDTLDDLEQGIDTIKKRSEGLLRFAETYRNLNKVTTLDLKKVLVRDLFENTNRLMLPTLEQKGIELDIILKDPGITIEADINLMEQVLINLVLNAIEAVKDVEAPVIVLSAYKEASRTVIKVADNGSGIPAEILDKIFVPFFSTRKKGSGIGLSLCKQIMLLHKGNIQVQSREWQGTVFVMMF